MISSALPIGSTTNDGIQVDVDGAPFTQMYEGEKTFYETLRWPMVHPHDQARSLGIPVDIWQ
jgi:hypothetical protein